MSANIYWRAMFPGLQSTSAQVRSDPTLLHSGRPYLDKCCSCTNIVQCLCQGLAILRRVLVLIHNHDVCQVWLMQLSIPISHLKKGYDRVKVLRSRKETCRVLWSRRRVSDLVSSMSCSLTEMSCPSVKLPSNCL